MSHRYTLLLLTALNVHLLPAQTGVLNVNQVHALFHANGMISNEAPSGAPFFQVPAQLDGNGPSTLFAASIWIGGVDPSGTLHLAAERFGQNGNDFFPGPLGEDATIDPSTSEQFDRVWKIQRSDVLLHQAYHQCVADPDCDESAEFPGYVVPQAFLSWPAMGDATMGQAAYLAPFIDADGDGLYDPLSGDAPCVPGDQALFSIYNDKLTTHTESGGAPIGLEVHMTPFAYASADEAVARTVFVRYRIINRGSLTLQDSYIGLFNDFDLGNAADDHVQCDATRSLIMVLNGDNDDSGGSVPTYGAQPPAFGLMVLKGPRMDPDGNDDTDLSTPAGFNGTGFNDGVADNEHLGLGSFMSFSNTGFGTPTQDPSSAPAYYTYLQGLWTDQTPLTYGGSGYSTAPDAVPARFMFPGDSDPQGIGTGGTVLPSWTEANSPNAPGDRRVIGSMGPFTFAPGEEQEIVLAYVYARAASGGPQASVNALRLRADDIRTFAQSIPGLLDGASACFNTSVSVDDRAVPDADARLFPNPAGDVLTLVLPGATANATVDVLDARGILVQHHRTSGPTTRLEVSDFPPGLYVLRVQDDHRVWSIRFVKQ